MWGWIKKAANTVANTTVKAATTVGKGAAKVGTSVAKGDIKGVAKGAMEIKEGTDMVNPKAIVAKEAVKQVKKQVKK